MLVGCGVVAFLLLGFGVTVGLVVYASMKPDGQAEKKESEGAASRISAGGSRQSRESTAIGTEPSAGHRRQPFADTP